MGNYLASRKSESPELASLLARGGNFLQQDKVREARTCFERALMMSPENEKTLDLLGLAHFRLSDFDAAQKVYEMLTTTHSDDASYLLNLGLVHLKQGKAEEAIEALSRSRQLDPTQSRAVSYLGLAYARNGEYSQAYEAFLRAKKYSLADEMEPHLDVAVQEEIKKRVSQSPGGRRDTWAVDSEVTPSFGVESENWLAENNVELGRRLGRGTGTEFIPTIEDEISSPKLDRVPLRQDEGVISRALGEAHPVSESVRASIGGTACIHSPPLRISDFSERNMLRLGESGQALEIGPGGVLMARVAGQLISRTHGVMVLSGELDIDLVTRRIRGKPSDETFGIGHARLFAVTGHGCMIASPCGEVYTALSMKNDVLYLREEYVFAFEPWLRWENGCVPGLRLQMAQFRGIGCVALRTPRALLCVPLRHDRAMQVESEALAGWIGGVVPRLAGPVMGSHSPCSLVECSGEGIILIHDAQGVG